jgi:hypothetical protein
MRTPLGATASDGPDRGSVTVSAVDVVAASAGRLELDGLATLVPAAVRADVMRQLHLVAVRTFLEDRRFDGQVRASLALASM